MGVVIKKGDIVEVYGGRKNKQWRSCEVLYVSDDKTRIMIHYQGFSKQYDKWIGVDSEDLKIFGNQIRRLTSDEPSSTLTISLVTILLAVSCLLAYFLFRTFTWK